MFTVLKAKFQQPYPFYYRGSSLLLVMLVVFLMVWSFDFFFRPFHVNYGEHKMPYYLIAAIHACTPVILVFILSAGLRVGKVNTEHWTMGKEVLFIVVLLGCSGVGQWLIRDIIYDNPRNWSLGYLWEEVRNALLVGALLAGFVVPLNLNRLRERNIRKALTLQHLKTEDGKIHALREEKRIELRGTDTYHFNPDKLLFVRSEGNYCEIHSALGGSVQKELVRLALRSFEQQMQEYPDIIRVHRSYMVNLEKVQSVSGNAQGYRLKMEFGTEEVPVSRSYLAEFNKHYS